MTRKNAIYFGLIEQLIYDYVRSKYDPRLRKGKPNLQVINRDVHVAKCAIEARYRADASWKCVR